MSTPGKVAAIRKAMPLTLRQVYLNTGTAGPMTRQLVERINRANDHELEAGRSSMAGIDALVEAMDRLRAELAALLHVTAAEIALTQNTTTGLNIVPWGLSWQAGDEIVTTTSEHVGGLLPLYEVSRRYGAVLRLVEVTPGREVEELGAALTPRTRLMMFSHVPWPNGYRLPIERLVELCHSHDVLCLVDGAQAAGAIDVDLRSWGVDFYSLPVEKWLCGPEGLGALYVRADLLSVLAPTFLGRASVPSQGGYDLTGYFMPVPGAPRYEVSTLFRPPIFGMVENLRWLAEFVEWPWAFARIRHLAQVAREVLAGLPGIEFVTPPDQAGLLTFRLAGRDALDLATRLDAQGITVRYVQPLAALRISTGFYNTEEEIEQLVAALRELSGRR